MDIDLEVRRIFTQHDLPRFGWTELKTPLTFTYYEEWLKRGDHGNMDYLVKHAGLKRDPKNVLSLAKTAIAFAVPYWPNPQPEKIGVPEALNVAKYARGNDYHHWLKGKLGEVITDMKAIWPDDQFLAFVDSGPVLERDLAVRAGLGWIGKNTCLIREGEGSYFFIAEIYTSLSMTETFLQAADRCGTCTRCIDACPTGALTAPRMLNANLCLSYLTIESKLDPNIMLRGKTQGQFYGCDICQDVCPWNIKAIPSLSESTSEKPADHLIALEITEILNASNSQIEKRFAGSAMLRARPWMHKRNAIWMAVYFKQILLIPVISQFTTDARLGEFSKWAIAELKNCP